MVDLSGGLLVGSETVVAADTKDSIAEEANNFGTDMRAQISSLWPV